MRITYLHQYFNTPSMPGGTRSYEMARRFVAMGHEVQVITSLREEGQGKGWLISDEAGIKVHWIAVPYSNRMSFGQRLRAFFLFALRSAPYAAALDADIVFATSTPLTIAFPGVYAAWRLKAPLVFEVRDLWPEMPIAMGALKGPLRLRAARALESWAYRNSSAVVALSPGMKQGVVNAGYPPSNIAVIPNSSDNLEFRFDPGAANTFRAKRSWLDDRPLLVYAGTFGRVNGVGYLVDLAKALFTLGSDIRLLLVGDGAECKSIIHNARQVGVYQQNLFVEDRVSKREVTQLFSAATMVSSVFIDLPEMRANSANKFFDGLAAGKPVFLNYGGWMHDLVTAHRCGVCAWGRPVDEVARELHIRLHDADWLRAAGLASRHLAETYFDRDVLAGQLEKVLLAAVNGEPERVESIAPGLYV
jgi:glycosyltransferase involved in cell wall biosynthesis